MKIGIVGLGLIGGCLGLDLRQLGHTVLGVARRPETCSEALRRGIVDRATSELALLELAEVVFICTPIAAIVPTVKALAAVLPASAVITDVGSVKTAIAVPAAQLWPNFVGGHPMSGKSEAGLAAAEAGIFSCRPYVLTPLAETPPAAVALVADLAEQLRSELCCCSPLAHDRAVAWISHLPVMVSAGLIQACLNEPDPTIAHLAQRLASSGFRDTSRVGGGNPELGMMMARYNREPLLRSLYHYQAAFGQLIQQIENEDWQALATQLAAAAAARQDFVD